MRIELSDPRAAKELTRFFRGRNYLAVEREPGLVEVVPIESTGRQADDARALRDLAEWQAENPGVTATPAGD